MRWNLPANEQTDSIRSDVIIINKQESERAQRFVQSGAGTAQSEEGKAALLRIFIICMEEGDFDSGEKKKDNGGGDDDEVGKVKAKEEEDGKKGEEAAAAAAVDGEQ